jgi:hypothetical protein
LAPTLTQRHLNRALLARQLLLKRARTTLPNALEQVAGLQAQYAPSMYIGLWSRLKGFKRDDLTRALEKRSVVQGTLMRVTIHLVSARDYWLFASGVRRSRREWWLRVQPKGSNPRDLAAAASRLRRHLAGGPMHRATIDELLGKPLSGGVGLWVDLVRVPPSGTWERRRADLYASAEEWLGPADVTPEEGLKHLVCAYLRGFGPATPGDIADWAGVAVRDVALALARLRLRRFRSENGKELFDLPSAPLPDPEVPAPARFLPTWDATLLAHARRTGVLPENYRPRVFTTKTPQSVATFLVDGKVAGIWKYEQGKVRLEPFERLDRSTLRELREESERLAAFHA